MVDILARIQELRGQLESIQRADRYRQELGRKLNGQTARLDELGKVMEKEHQDVIELEQWSLKELFVKMIDKEEKLEAEKEEYLQAAITYRDLKKEVELIEYEIGVLEEKISAKNKLEAQLQKLYNLREAEMLNNDPDHPLRKILEEMARWKQIDRELEEAINCGIDAQLTLKAISDHLNVSKNRVIPNLQDNSYLVQLVTEEVDQARLRLPKLRLELSKFEEQLKEVFQYSELEGWSHKRMESIRQVQQLVQQLSEISRYYLLNMLQPRSVLQQLHQSQTLADQIRRQTDASVKWLRVEQTKVKYKISQLEKEKQKLLT